MNQQRTSNEPAIKHGKKSKGKQANESPDCLLSAAITIAVVARPEPLDYFLTRRQVGNWTAVRGLIQTCHVHVDGVLCKHYQRTLTADSIVTVDGRIITDSEDAGTLICHKMLGLACSHAPQDAPLIYDAVPEAWRHENLQTVGRLDRDTTGLLLFTIDGTWAQRIVSPKRVRWKRYRVAYSGTLVADAEQQVTKGLLLADEATPCLAARLSRNDAAEMSLSVATLELCEGRHHQVKRMIQALGGKVERLHRDRIGGLELPADLRPGEFRPLSVNEREALLRCE